MSAPSKTSTPRLENGLLDVTSIPQQVTAAYQYNTSSRLLSLPGELRNAIWKVVLYSPEALELEPIISNKASRPRPVCSRSRSQYPGSVCRLARVCRATYADTAVLVYANTKFLLPPTSEGKDWLAARLPYQLNAIHTFVLRGDGFPLGFNQGKGLSTVLPRLKTLIIRGWDVHFISDILFGRRPPLSRAKLLEFKFNFVDKLKQREAGGVKVVVILMKEI